MLFPGASKKTSLALKTQAEGDPVGGDTACSTSSFQSSALDVYPGFLSQLRATLGYSGLSATLGNSGLSCWATWIPGEYIYIRS